MLEGVGRTNAILGFGIGIKVECFEAAGMSREGSADRLRTYDVPTTESVLPLSSDSKSSMNDDLPIGEDNSDGREPTPRKSSESDDDDDNEVIGKFIGKSVRSPSGKSPKKGETVEELVPQKKKSDESKKREGKTKAVVEKPSKPNELNDSVLVLSSDSDSETRLPREDDGESSDLKISQLQSRGNTEDAAGMGINEESPSKQASKGKPSKKSPKGKGQSPKKEKNKMDSNRRSAGISGDVEVEEKEASVKQIEPHVSSSTLLLMLSEKVHRTKALVECERDSIDLSGDMGAGGRVIVSESRSGHSLMCLDLKGTVYIATTVPSRTFCVVSFGPSEAKVDRSLIMNDFIQLKPETYETETIVEGTLEGFLFDSEDEANKVPKTIPHQTDNDENTEQTNGKADKASKRDKPSGGKPQPPKKARKKTQVSKKPKNKK